MSSSRMDRGTIALTWVARCKLCMEEQPVRRAVAVPEHRWCAIALLKGMGWRWIGSAWYCPTCSTHLEGKNHG